MRLQQVLDELVELLQHPEFKSIGALRKSQFQNDKSEDELFLRSDMYKGTKGNSEAVKKGHITRKKNPKYKEDIKKAAEKRADWYKDPENKIKFLKRLEQRITHLEKKPAVKTNSTADPENDSKE